jgi:hypothetical protein
MGDILLPLISTVDFRSFRIMYSELTGDEGLVLLRSSALPRLLSQTTLAGGSRRLRKRITVNPRAPHQRAVVAVIRYESRYCQSGILVLDLSRLLVCLANPSKELDLSTISRSASQPPPSIIIHLQHVWPCVAGRCGCGAEWRSRIPPDKAGCEHVVPASDSTASQA